MRRHLHKFRARPLWMNGLLLFCAYMTFIYVPWDLFIKPLAEDEEVWFGLLFTGWWAKAGAVLHWLVYGAGFWGFLKMRSWMHPWAAVYVLQVAFSMGVYSVSEGEGVSLLIGAIVTLLFVALAVLLLRQRSAFKTSAFKNSALKNSVSKN